jgi:hypothetical protein
MEAPRTRMFALTAAVSATVVLAACASSATPARAALGIERAKSVARTTVLADPSYGQITARTTGLQTRRCRRLAARRVRCTLYVVVPNPCALGTDQDRVCAQVLWERRWLVEATRDRHRVPAGRILKISAGPAGATAVP